MYFIRVFGLMFSGRAYKDSDLVDLVDGDVVTLVRGGVGMENSGVERLGVGWRGETMMVRVRGRLLQESEHSFFS